jgi:hypothetical protein
MLLLLLLQRQIIKALFIRTQACNRKAENTEVPLAARSCIQRLPLDDAECGLSASINDRTCVAYFLREQRRVL